ncbi:hypothetical protein [Chitinophaga tropicalis]|uniref:Uncharacterized protein n=1 Tax=Chitinophaga tropicalis TaxID=2683588 RepID=A0A7K1UAF2_9BACT|nr:hypothetical protein [Chitinophaga tropicalis]MVT11354.1 hypothetical protein [Chitinophaga tropicalis]
MDTDTLQKRLDRLLNVAEKVRHHQKRYFGFKTSVDLEKAKYYERQLDKLLKEEGKIKESQQKELF